MDLHSCTLCVYLLTPTHCFVISSPIFSWWNFTYLALSQHITVLPKPLEHTQSLGSFHCLERRKFKEDCTDHSTLEQLDLVQHNPLLQHERPFIYLFFLVPRMNHRKTPQMPLSVIILSAAPLDHTRFRLLCFLFFLSLLLRSWNWF
jgi:hypothetical protein